MRSGIKQHIRRLLPRRVKVHRIKSGRLAGRRIVTSWHDYPGAILGRTEKPLLDWFSTVVREGDTWLDVGAHYGYTSIALALLTGGKGRVFAFEPTLATVGHLAETRRVNDLTQLTILPFALGYDASIGIFRLPVVRGMADSTLTDSTEHDTLLSVRLDWLWPLICGRDQSISGVKIDVQGMELSVLRGMVDTLRHNRPRLVLEFHRGVDRHAVIELLASAGYLRPGQSVESSTQDGLYEDDKSYVFETSTR